MEWALLVTLAIAAALAIAGPALRGRARAAVGASIDAAGAADELRAERARLLAELRELDDDARNGRIAAADRALGRRALGPQLRAVTEALRAAGWEPRP
ncbi:MAG: hypothetical protein EXR63_04285 [Dehalococcoidia bacterium]|nr:hypothetical protein [Dehalococcoidia bacterium]